MNSDNDAVDTAVFQTSVFGDGVLTYPWLNTKKEERTMPEESKPTRAYGPVELADDTRQSQNQVANDAPVDMNPNAIICRSQMLTLDIAGKGFTAAAERRQIIADSMLGK